MEYITNRTYLKRLVQQRSITQQIDHHRDTIGRALSTLPLLYFFHHRDSSLEYVQMVGSIPRWSWTLHAHRTQPSLSGR